MHGETIKYVQNNLITFIQATTTARKLKKNQKELKYDSLCA